MPRDAVALTALTANGAEAEPAGVTIAPANGAVVAAPGRWQRLVLRVTNTAASAKDVTVKAGANPPAFRAGLGDLVVSVDANTGVKYITLESARFAQADGTVHVDFASGMTGKVAALKLPGA